MLSEAKVYVKSYATALALSPNRYVIDLSNEVLNINFGQGAAKIPEIKVGVRSRAHGLEPGRSADIVSELQL